MSARFWAKVDRGQAEDCWPWRGAVQSAGYGNAKIDGAWWLAHRFAWTELVGTIGANLVLDHLCENTLCVNPAHLEPVPQGVNLARAAGKRTTCRHGHPLDGWRRGRGRDGAVIRYRYCRTCHSAGRRVRARVQDEGHAQP